MSTLTCPHLAVSLHPHVLHCCAPCLLHEPCRWAFVTTCAMLLCPLRLHALRCLAPCGCTHRVAVLKAPFAGLFSACMLSFFFFLLTSSFAVQSPYPNGTMVMWPRGHDNDDHSYGTTRHDDNHYNHSTTRRDNRDHDATCGMTAVTTTTHSTTTMTTTTTPHGTTTATMTPL